MSRRLLASATLLCGCGGGAPLMYPAHTLPASAVTFAGGTSGRVALGELSSAQDALDSAAGIPGGASTPQEQEAFVQGALARFAVAPGLAPFVAGRVGLGSHNEAGISYTGRSVRIDGRHAFEWPELALSLGLAATGALARPGDTPDAVPMGQSGLRSAELNSLRGYGLELPVVFGYRSDADVVLLWCGLRAGFESDTFDFTLVQTPDEVYGSNGEAMRLWAGGLIGFAIGLPPIQVRAELNAAYESVSGYLVTGTGELNADVAGLSVTPAMAISAKF